MKPFYFVYVDGQKMPEFKHDNYESASKEAERLAEKTDKRVYIMQSIEVVELCKFKYTKIVENE